MTRCPKCNSIVTVRTPVCHPKNPIFDCAWGQKNIAHTHFWCAWCAHSWVEVKGDVSGLNIGSPHVARERREGHDKG